MMRSDTTSKQFSLRVFSVAGLKLGQNTTRDGRHDEKVHDEAERDRKRNDGDFRHRRIGEPSLTIHTQLPEDEERERQEEIKAMESACSDVDGGKGGETELGEPSGVDEGARDADRAQDAWALVTEEVRFRLKTSSSSPLGPASRTQADRILACFRKGNILLGRYVWGTLQSNWCKNIRDGSSAYVPPDRVQTEMSHTNHTPP